MAMIWEGQIHEIGGRDMQTHATSVAGFLKVAT
jgi:hypothetical protein